MQSVATYFKLEDPQELTWAHGVNSRSYLEECCRDAGLHMIEGDIHFADADALPCVAHHWQDIADMDVADWLAEITTAGKGVKLDFADADAVEPTLAVLQRMKIKTPVVLHANVFNLLPPENAAADEGMEPEQFVRMAQDYCPAAVLSLGWSLKREADHDGRMEEMLIHQMSDMVLKRLGGMDYEIEIRAGYTSGWERGAALIFDPQPTSAPAATAGGPNVVNAAHLFRKVA